MAATPATLPSPVLPRPSFQSYGIGANLRGHAPDWNTPSLASHAARLQRYPDKGLVMASPLERLSLGQSEHTRTGVWLPVVSDVTGPVPWALHARRQASALKFTCVAAIGQP